MILQFLAGLAAQRTGYTGLWLRLIAWITLVGAPITVLLQAQVTFLPYHLLWVQWLLRVLIVIDLIIIWCFWDPVRSEDLPLANFIQSATWRVFGVLATALVIVFSVFLAISPGETVNNYFWTLPLREKLFSGEVDEVTRRPRSLFSNHLVLNDESFVDNDRLVVSHSFRGRDLRQAMLNDADLRNADFTGAMLNDVHFQGAKLQRAQFRCGNTGRKSGFTAEELRWPEYGCAWLQNADLEGAELQGANFNSAQLQGANLEHAQLQGVDLTGAMLQGADLSDTQLKGADLNGAQLHSADLNGAQLQGANLEWAELQGADLTAQFQGASLNNAYLWLARGNPNIDLTDVEYFDTTTTPWHGDGDEEKWKKMPSPGFDLIRIGIFSEI